MVLNDFLKETFPHLELRPPLFYNWDIGIRFELGIEEKWGNEAYISECYKRAITLFEALHFPIDDIFIVMDVHDFEKGKNLKRKRKSFSPYVDKSSLYKLKYQMLPYIFSEDDEEGRYKTHRFTLKCKPNEVKCRPLLKAICNQDLGYRPSISHQVYFINIHKKTIFHVYDDRGADLLATASDTIREIYETYHDWILDYDKVKIDEIFK